MKNNPRRPKPTNKRKPKKKMTKEQLLEQIKTLNESAPVPKEVPYNDSAEIYQRHLTNARSNVSPSRGKKV